MADRQPVQRLFFALWPDENLRAGITQAVREAVRGSGGKPVAPENYHVTLKFLGSVDASRKGALCAAAARIRVSPFEVIFDRIGFWAQPRILWLGAESVPAPLAALVQALEAMAAAEGFEPESRPYRPHVSLARKVSSPDLTGACGPIRWRAENFVLAASETVREGAHYRVLRSWPLL